MFGIGVTRIFSDTNAEIKTLLADLLGQEEIRTLGQKASETARLLKAGLSVTRQELVGLGDEGRRLGTERQRLEGAPNRVSQAIVARLAAQQVFEAAQARHATLAAECDQSRATEARRTQLAAEYEAQTVAIQQAIDALKLQAQGEQQRLERLRQRIASRLQWERRAVQPKHAAPSVAVPRSITDRR